MADEAGSIRSVAAAILEKRPTTPVTATPPVGQEPPPVVHDATTPKGEEDEDQNLLPEGDDGQPSGDDIGDIGGEGDGGDDDPVYRIKIAGEDREVSLCDFRRLPRRGTKPSGRETSRSSRSGPQRGKPSRGKRRRSVPKRSNLLRSTSTTVRRSFSRRSNCPIRASSRRTRSGS
jgi:hypothetical protein